MILSPRHVMKECRNTGNCEEQWGTVRSQQKLIVSILIPLQPSVLCAEILSALPGLEASCASYGHSYGDILCKLNIEVFSSIQNYWMVNMLFIFILYTHSHFTNQVDWPNQAEPRSVLHKIPQISNSWQSLQSAWYNVLDETINKIS